MKLKKLLALLMMLCMIMCCCVACSSDSDDDDDDDKKTEQSSDDKDDDADADDDDDADADDDDDADADDDDDDADADDDDDADADNDDDADADDDDDADADDDDDAGLGDDSGATDDIEGEWTMEVNYADLLYSVLEIEIDAELILPLVWDFEDDGTYTLVCEDVPSEDEINEFSEAYFNGTIAWMLESFEISQEDFEEMIVEQGYDSYDDYVEEGMASCLEEVQGICEGFEESVGGTWELDGTTINLDTVDYLEVEIDGDTMTIVDASTDLAMFVGTELTR